MGILKKEQTEKEAITLKRCPKCSANLKIDATECVSCGIKVHGIDEFGKAKRPINWGAYLFTFLAWSGFLLYVWWAFFKDLQ